MLYVSLFICFCYFLNDQQTKINGHWDRNQRQAVKTDK